MKSIDDIKAFLQSRETGITVEQLEQKAAGWPNGQAKDLLLLLIDRHPDCLTIAEKSARSAASWQKLTVLLIENKPDWRGQLKPCLDAFMDNAWQPLFIRTLESLSGVADWNGYRAPSGQDWYIGYVRDLCTTLMRYRLTVEEYINWHRGGYGGNSHMAFLFATALNDGNDTVFQQINQILQGEAESGLLTEMHLLAFLQADRDDCREAIQKLLLSAQRQEGLRRSILDKLKKAAPKTVGHLLHIIAVHDLMRFKSVANGVAELFHQYGGLAHLSDQEQKSFLVNAIQWLDNPSAAEPATPVDACLALWAHSVYDTDTARPLTLRLLESNDPEMRAVALWHLRWTEEVEQQHRLALRHLQDTDKCVAFWADYNLDIALAQPHDGAFETYLKLLDRVPKSGWSVQKSPWSWQNYSLTFPNLVQKVMRWAEQTGSGTERIFSHWDKMDKYSRGQLIRTTFPAFYKDQHLYQQPGAAFPEKISHVLSPFEWALIQRALADRTEDVVSTGVWLFERKAANEVEMEALEWLLKGKNDNIRFRTVRAIAAQEKSVCDAGIERLSNGTEEQRTAALDLLKHWYKAAPGDPFLLRMSGFFTASDDLSGKEKVLLDGWKDTQAGVEFTPENGFGLYDPGNRSPAGELSAPMAGDYVNLIKNSPNGGFSVSIGRLQELLMQLDELIVARKGLEYEATNPDGSTVKVVFGAGDYISRMYPARRQRSWHVEIECLPFEDVWNTWRAGSGLTELDLFILKGEIVRWMSFDRDYPEWLKKIAESHRFNPMESLFPGNGKSTFQYPTSIQQLLAGFSEQHPYQDEYALYVEICEHLFRDIPADKINEVFYYNGEPNATWRNVFRTFTHQAFYVNSLETLTDEAPVSDELFERAWRLLFWQYRIQPDSGQKAGKLHPAFFIRAHQLGLITADELYFQILHDTGNYAFLTDERLPQTRKAFEAYPFLLEVMDNCRTRILDIELKRGDTPTPVSEAATHLKAVFGIGYFSRLLTALGDDVFHQGYVYQFYGNVPKRQILSQLLNRCFPLPTETATDFQNMIRAEQFSEKRLIEAAMYAPQWLPWTAHALGWQHLEPAAWWFHAHANEAMDAQKETESAKYSPISAQSFKDGAVDVQWFRSAYNTIGAKRWSILYDAARYICDNNGHARARLYADAILGTVLPADLEPKIKRYRNRDNLVAYGLIPLREQGREADLLSRYRQLQSFNKESRDQSATRKAKETEAVHYAFENLARTAGYEDPVRLIWEMETRDAHELMARVQTLDFNGVRVQLVVDTLGKADVKAVKNGKAMADLPAQIKKDPAILELRGLRDLLREQQSRVRRSLEEAMLRGDAFRPAELTNLLQHPVVRPMLSSLVLLSGDHFGFWENDALRSLDGRLMSLDGTGTCRIAHCTDLFNSGQWSAFQRYLFDQKQVQPFKQVFRELYTLSPDESHPQTAVSHRYQGHQVQPAQAAALLRNRGWTVEYSEGFQKIFARENLVAHLTAYADWYHPGSDTPQLENVRFSVRSSSEPVPLAQVPPRIFSEVMRDIDLVVGVAHAGGVDPDAGLSSIALRRVILEETARLFQLDNLTFLDHHVLIRGQIATYSLHLGSGTIHRMPGGAITIRAVHTAGRGRIFLPFADEDPVTAEIVSKMLLLAKDTELKDPTVLDQL